LQSVEGRMMKRFSGQFDALSKVGAGYVNDERFRPLRHAGKPLWEFKEHDHRLYCARQAASSGIVVVLLSGWIKQKEGKSGREAREIQRALNLYAEYMNELSGGKR
jgi:hypothetical protein